MASDKDTSVKRYVRLPKTPKKLIALGLPFREWMAWYIEYEKRLNANHALGRIGKRIDDELEGKAPVSDEVDALKFAEERVAKARMELGLAEAELAAAQKEQLPPIPAYEGDIAVVLESDWKFVLGLLTDEKDPPECGFGPPMYRRQPDGSIAKIPFATRDALDYIDAWRDASTKPPEVVTPEAEPAVEVSE